MSEETYEEKVVKALEERYYFIFKATPQTIWINGHPHPQSIKMVVKDLTFEEAKKIRNEYQINRRNLDERYYISNTQNEVMI